MERTGARRAGPVDLRASQGRLKRAVIITDAWSPQTNGVVTTLKSVIAELPALGFQPAVIHPGDFSTIPLPSYPEIRIAKNPWRIREMLPELAPDTIHVATEGPLGLYARWFLSRHEIPFTTSLHTKFPEYVNERTRIPVSVGYRFLRWFHRPAHRTLCTTETHKRELEEAGLDDLVAWGRGVDTKMFRPDPKFKKRVRPRLLYVGRVAVEKNIEALLSLDYDADIRIVGDGPQRAELEQKYPHAEWVGYKRGQELVDEYAAADVFVFPSRTDTFGLVMLEAMACGTPVAAYPVTGPIDVVRPGVTGCLSESLSQAVDGALNLDRAWSRAYVVDNSWGEVAKRMADNFAVITKPVAETSRRQRRLRQA